MVPFSFRHKQFHRPNTPASVAYVKYIELNAYGNQYRLMWKKSVSDCLFTTNGMTNAIPFTDTTTGVNVVRSGGYVVISTSFGLTVQYNGAFFASLCDSYANKVCGLCGNYDGKINQKLVFKFHIINFKKIK